MSKFLIYGNNCAPCHRLREEFARDIEDGKVFVICAEDNMPLCRALGIKTVPTLIETTDGEEAIREKLKNGGKV